MKVAELVSILQALPDQQATVVFGDDDSPNSWLIVTGIIERQISRKIQTRRDPGMSQQSKLFRPISKLGHC
jgi:hypothetical protein